MNTNKEQSAANKENDDQMENGEEIAFPLEKVMLLNFPSENIEQQQQEENYESAVVSVGSLRRRVTFSDLNTIFEAPEVEAQLEENECSEIELKQEDNIPKLGCPVKDMEGIEERRKVFI